MIDHGLPGSHEIYIGHDSTLIDDQQYGTGCLPRATVVGSVWPVWGSMDSAPLVPESEWREQAEEAWQEQSPAVWDYNQGTDPSCCLFATANAIQRYFLRAGLPNVELDPRKAWIECTGGRGGYAIDGALTYCRNNGFPLKVGTDRVKLVEAWDCPSGAAAVSAVMRGCIVVFGWSGLGPHAECLTRLGPNKKPRVQNSWGFAWGDHGHHDVPLASIDAGIKVFGAFALRAFQLRPADSADLPDAKA